VVSMYQGSVDIILGSTWVDTLGTFMFNTRRKFLKFSYKKKKFTLQDATMKSTSEAPSSEDLKDISEVILPDNQKSIQKLQDRQEEYDKIIIEKDEEISRLRNHNQKLLAKLLGKMNVLILPLRISLFSSNQRAKPPSEHLHLDREKNHGSNRIAKQG
jgi:hypothetical protein